MRVLVVNAGSSTLKLSFLGDRNELVHATTLTAPAPPTGSAGPGPGGGDDAWGRELARLVERHGPVDAVGHRVVHGGADFVAPVRVDPSVRRRLGELVDLAPLHQPKSLRGLDLVGRLLPDRPAVACFDTAFHATLPPSAATYPVPAEWRRRWGIRRFGFHGLSHAYASRRAATLAGRPREELRLVTCHLGAGASLAAVAGGRSVDTTMGFTPLEGLMMATRSGSLDPGLVLWLEEHAGLSSGELAEALEHRSGLVALAGTADMKAALEAEEAGDPAAGLGVGVYLHRLRAGVAAMAAAMGGLDGLVFTGGVGERAPSVRRRVVEGLGFLGLETDRAADARPEPDRETTARGAPVRCFVVAAREDLEVARGVREVLDP